MRVCIDKKTGKLIEAQSGGDKQEHLNTLINNAILQGYKAGDVEAKFVEDSEFKTLLDEATLVMFPLKCSIKYAGLTH